MGISKTTLVAVANRKASLIEFITIKVKRQILNKVATPVRLPVVVAPAR